MAERLYKGFEIRETASLEARKWYVQTYNRNGEPYRENICPQFTTTAGARQWISDEVAANGLAQARPRPAKEPS